MITSLLSMEMEEIASDSVESKVRVSLDIVRRIGGGWCDSVILIGREGGSWIPRASLGIDPQSVGDDTSAAADVVAHDQSENLLPDLGAMHRADVASGPRVAAGLN